MQQEIFTLGSHKFHTNEKIRMIKSGTNAVIFINDKQEAFRKGLNHGRLGMPMHIDKVEEFTKINISNVKLVDCGDTCSAFSTIYNELFISGFNTFGQLGLEDFKDRDNYTKIKYFDEKIRFLRLCGGTFIFVVTKNNKVFGCGENTKEQLGIPLITKDLKKINRLTEVITDNISEIKDLQCGECHTIILDKDGHVFAVGSNEDGQVGLGETKQVSKFTKLPINNVKQISCFFSGTLFLTNDCKLFGCGKNTTGALGMKIETPHYYKITEIVLANGIIVKQLFTTLIGEYNVILTQNDEIYGTGLDDEGQLGLNPEEYKTDEEEFYQFVDSFKKLNFKKIHKYVTVVAEYYNLIIINSNYEINVEENEDAYLKKNRLLRLFDGVNNNFTDISFSLLPQGTKTHEPYLKKQKII